MPEVFAVVVSYNGVPWLASCLESLRRSDPPVSILVVDNASRDDSVAIARSIDGVEVLQQSTNLGFGRANNVGIAYALRRGAEFVFLLNQDAEVEPNTISDLLAFMRRHDDVGVASPVHLDDSGTLLDRNFLLHYLAPQVPQFVSDAYGGDLAAHYRVSSVNAAAWLVSRRCLQEVGGFDPIFFMYGEDDDYCARMRYHGFTCYIVSHARIRHARGFHQPAYRRGRLQRVMKSARFARAQAVRALKDPADESLIRSGYREVTTLALDGLSRSIASLTLSPLLPSLLAAAMVCRDLPRIAKHKRACLTRGPTWLDLRLDPGPASSESFDLFRDPGVPGTDARVRYVLHDVNRGASWNHNFVINEARGRFFRWHHADDLCEPRHLESCVATLESDPTLVLAYPQTLLIDGASRVTGRYDDRLDLHQAAPHARVRRLLANVFLCNPILGLIRTGVLRRTALLGSYLRSDHVLLAELALAGRWAGVPEGLFYRRIHAGKSTEANRSLQDRAAWFDPRLRSRRFFWPNLRLFAEHLQAVRRAPLAWQEKAACEMRQMRTRLVRIRKRLATWTGVQGEHGHVLAEPAPQTVPAESGWTGGAVKPRLSGNSGR